MIARLVNYLQKVSFVFRNRRSVTVAVMYPLAMVSGVALVATIAATNQDVSYVRISTPNALAEVGVPFAINVYAYAAEPVNAVNIQVGFDETQLEVTGVDVGQSVITLWTEDPYVADGVVVLEGGTYRRGFVGEHLIATINARAQTSGEVTFTVNDKEFLIGDGTGDALLVGSGNGETISVYVLDQNQSPSDIGAMVSVGISTDIDGDGTVSLRDISVFMAAWFSGSAQYDFNDDGRMNFTDFSIILSDSWTR